MSELIQALSALLPEGMDFEGAIIAVMAAFVTTRQQSKISLLRCVAAHDEEIAAELNITVETVKEHGRWSRTKLRLPATRLVGPFLIGHLHKASRSGSRESHEHPPKRG